MAESTSATMEAPVGSPERRRAQERNRAGRARREVTSDIAERGVCAAAALIRKDSPPWFSAEGTAAAQITAQTALTLGTMWAERRPMRASEATTFRVLGDLATRARLTEEEAIGAMEAGWDELLGVARGAISGGMWSPRTGKAALRELESEAQEFADRAATELRLGIAGEIGCACDRVGVLLRVLDGRLVGEELGAAASKAGLDASRPHGIVLLVDRFGRTGPLDMAAGEVADEVAHTVDLGLGDGLPVHRRLVLPMLTAAQWLEARTDLDHIGDRCGVLVVAPAAAPNLAGLGEGYRATVESLTATVADCGRTKGIIDPACVDVPSDGESAEPELALAGAA